MPRSLLKLVGALPPLVLVWYVWLTVAQYGWVDLIHGFLP